MFCHPCSHWIVPLKATYWLLSGAEGSSSQLGWKLSAMLCMSKSGLAQPVQTSLTLLAFACRHWNVRFQKEMWEALDSSGFHCNFCTSSARHWCFYLLHVSCCPYIFFWQGPSVEHFRLSQGLPSTCHVSGFSLMGLRDKNQN